MADSRDSAAAGTGQLTATGLLLPPAADLTWEQAAGRSCVWCDTPITRGGYSVGKARGRIGAHSLDTEVYAGPCCPNGRRS